jgi:O-antigen/teichoic acid export membrane protein
MLAKLLSPFEFGMWSYAQLIIMYFAHLDFGIPSSFNALAAIHKQNKKFVTFNFNASLTLTALLCGVVILFFIASHLIGFSTSDKYHFDSYLFYVLVIIILSYFNKILMNLFRVYNRLKEITFFQGIVPIFMLGTYILFKEDLIDHLLLGIIFANVIALLLFLYNSPLTIQFNFSKKLLTQIQKSGIYFFIYNASFYFILLTTRNIIGYFYTVEEFGLFNFAFSLANIVELLLSAFVFLIFPKMINRLANSDNQTAIQTIGIIQGYYTSLVSLMSYSAIAIFPFFITLFPAYTNTIVAFNIILLTKLIYTNCFGAPVLLMARKKERSIAAVAFVALVINILASLIIVYFFDVSYHYAMLGTGIAYVIYVPVINRMSLLELHNYKGFFDLLRYSFPLEQLIPLLIGFILLLSGASIITLPIVLFVFMIFNFKSLFQLKNLVFSIVKNSSITDL